LVLTADDAVDATIAALRPGLGEGVYVVDHSTNLPACVAERSARLRAEGVRYVHAPVFMSPQNAREASGILLLAAPAADAEALTPALAHMTGKVWHVGERPDLAAVHKLVGNGALIALAGAMGDLLAVGAAQGLSSAEVLSLFDVFRPAVGFVGQRVATAGDKPASFELRMARKDVRLMIETAGGPGRLTVLPAVAAAMDDAIAQGRGDQDFAVFARPKA
ncbi:MAG: NAD(P)-binding domain-containing protein, partial [Myxococcota bacterium]